MEPKFEQPKQYTPEEIAQLEKSRTISDAELLKGGAEYVVNQKGEKENLSITNEQEVKLHKEFESKETSKRENEERQEALLKAAPLFVEEMGQRIKERFEAGDLDAVMIMSGANLDKMSESLNQKQVDFLEDIRHAFNKSGLYELTDGYSCKHCFVRSVAQGGDIELAQQLLIGLGGSGSIEKGDWSLGSNWGEKR